MYCIYLKWHKNDVHISQIFHGKSTRQYGEKCIEQMLSCHVAAAIEFK